MACKNAFKSLDMILHFPEQLHFSVFNKLLLFPFVSKGVEINGLILAYLKWAWFHYQVAWEWCLLEVVLGLLLQDQ